MNLLKKIWRYFPNILEKYFEGSGEKRYRRKGFLLYIYMTKQLRISAFSIYAEMRSCLFTCKENGSELYDKSYLLFQGCL
jgi:hypothetical protein